MRGRTDLTVGPIGKTLVRLTVPMIAGMLGMVIFNIVDTFWIGRLGTVPLAAMSFTFPVVMLQGSISMGLGVGASAVIARAIGAGDRERVRRLTTDSLILSVSIVILFVGLGLATVDPLFRLLGANGETLVQVKRYMTIWYLGVPFVVIPMVGNNAIRAAGNTLVPSLVMLTAVVVNMILDPLLIFGIGPFPRMEIRGAALATVIARSTTLTLSLLLLRYRFDMLTGKTTGFREMLRNWGSILYIGLPAAVTQAILPVSMGVVTRMAAGFGREVVAALGVGTRIQTFALAPLMALAAVMVPFVGQNLGADRPDRIRRGIRFAVLFAFGLGLAEFAVLAAFGRPLGGLFNSDPAVVSHIGRFLAVVPLGFGGQGVILVVASAFNALRRPFRSAAIHILRLFVLYIPLAYLGSRILGPTGIFAGNAVSAVIAGVVSALWIDRSEIRRAESPAEKAPVTRTGDQ